jgi:Glycoside hydrolase family 44/Fibronectin type III domain
MAKRRRENLTGWILLAMASALFLQSCGGSGYGGGGGQKVYPPAAPTGLTATAGVQQVSLAWTASSGATSYNVKRGTVGGGPYTQLATATTPGYLDSAVTGGTKYYYVVTAVNAGGESGNSNEASTTPTVAPPVAPTGLTAIAGDKQVALTWNASTGATSYNVKRSTTHGGPYATVNSPTGTSYTDMGLTDGTKYYYVVSAVNAGGESANSSEVSATPAASSASVLVTVDVLTNRHPISPYVYGGAFPKDAATITDSRLTTVRWGGNGASTYNWQLGTSNADNDYYFEDFAFGALNNSADSDSTQFIKDVKAAGSAPLMTMVMLPWVAQTKEAGNGHWSFSVVRHGAQCHTDQYNPDAGDGIVFAANCDSSPTYITADATDLNNTYFPLLDDHTKTCPSGTTCEYRNDWAAALATAFGSAPHFYDMDNEIDIWGGTHRDIHPSPTTYQELRDIYLSEARSLKGWDPAAIRLGPVSCCWYYYWRSATGNSDTSSNGGVDFLPWWLNEVAWSDAVAGSRSLDIFDIHAYPDADTGGLTQTQLQALAVKIYRDWWDPTFTSAAQYIVKGGFSIEPVDSKPFRIPRMRAILNSTYPDTKFAITEWSAAFAGNTSQTREADFSTALGDADAYGILGRERVYLSTRWTAPDPANPNYLALKLYTNYDGSHHGFATTSVSDTNDGDPNLFSSYAALDSTGKTLTVIVLNKDPKNSVTAQLTTNSFTPSSVMTYTLAVTAPTTIAKATPAWSSTMTFAPYTATLLVITGTTASTPASEWDLNPDTTMVAAGGTVTLQPKITSGTANVSLGATQSDAGITVTVTQGNLTTTQIGTISVVAGNTPGFYHYTVPGTDTGATQTQGGWIVVGNPAATLAKTGGDGQIGTKGTTLPTPLTVTLTPDPSGGSKTGASILFTASAGSLSNGTSSGSKVIAVTNSSGVASVTLTLPSTAEAVTVNAEGPYGLGHPVAPTFMETSQ